MLASAIRWFLVLTLGFCIAAVQTSVMAEESATAPNSPSFNIVEFRVDGNSLLTEQEIKQAVAPYIGQSRNFGDVQNALRALQLAYQQAGFSAVQVVLPEQALEGGVVVFNVIPQKIALIEVKGNKHHDETNILNTLPALKVGESPNARQVARSLRVANENPSKYTTVHFKSSAEIADSIDATVRVIDEDTDKIFLTLDNTGNKQTKTIRMGIGYQNYNMFNRDHRFSAQFVTTPQSDFLTPFFDDLRVFALGYSIPLYSLGDSIDLFAAYSDANAGSLLGGALDISSRGTVYGAHYNRNLDRINNYQHKLRFGMDYRAYKPKADFGGFNLTPPVTATPLSASYAGVWKSDERQVSFNLGLIHNISNLAGNGGKEDFAAGPWLAENDYTRYTWAVDYTQLLANDWQLHLAANGQFASDHLHPGEQYGLGGTDSVRGWYERSFSGDRGYRWSAEAVSPNFGSKLMDNLTLRGLAFIDKGYVSNLSDINGNDPGNRLHIASAGVGLRFGYDKNLLGRMDLAVVVDGDKTDRPSATYQQQRDDGDIFMHMSLAWIW